MIRSLALLVRRERSDVIALILVMVLIALTTFLAAAGLRAYEAIAGDALRREVAEAHASQRTITLSTTRMALGRAADSVPDLHAEGEAMRAAFPEAVGSVAGDGNLSAGMVRMRVSNPPEYPMFLTLRYRDGIENLADLTSGRWPAATGDELPPVAELVSRPGSDAQYPTGTIHYGEPARVLEVAIQDTTARSLGVQVGTRLSVGVDLLDTLFQSSTLQRLDIFLAPTELEVTGLYRVRDLESDAWLGDTSLANDDLGLHLLDPTAFINGYVAADTLPALTASALPVAYSWRYPIVVDRLDVDQVPSLEAGMRALETRGAETELEGDRVTAQANLLPLLARNTAQRGASEAVLALAASAPLALAAAAIALGAVLLARRRRAPTTLARGRGATRRQLYLAILLEAAVVAFVASIVGLSLAIAALPDAKLQPSLAAAAGIAVVSVALLCLAAFPQAGQPLAELEGAPRAARRVDARRLVIELTVLVMAIVGAYLLSQRGVASATTGFDPFLTAVPPLIALAAGIVAIRIYRPATALASWLADRRRDLVPVLGLRAIARGAASSLPVLVLVLAVSFATFTSAVWTSLDQAQRTTSWTRVGADVRLRPLGLQGTLPTAADVAAVPGVEAVASGFADLRAHAPPGSGVATMTVHAVQPEQYAAVVDGSPLEPGWPAEFLAYQGDGPLPAILGNRLTRGSTALGVGDTFSSTILGRTVQFQVVEVRSQVTGITSGETFVITPLESLERATDRDVPPTVLWVRAPQEAAAQIAAEADATVEVASRYAVQAELSGAPLVGVVGAGFVVALIASMAYAVLTILGSVILSAGRRTRDDAILRTLGLNARQQTRLTMLEHTPPILIALPVGLLLGIAVAAVVTPALGIGALSGSRGGAVPLEIDWAALAILAAMLAAAGLIAVICGSWLSGRAGIANALRAAGD